MRNPHPLFICYPSVVCVGKPTKVYVVPQGTSRLFDEDKNYELCVAGIFEHRQADYHKELAYDVPCKVENGYLTFEYTFATEQEYTVRFRETTRKGQKNRDEAEMYAVKEDLFGRRPLKGDFHSHSYYSDARDDTAMTAANYREEGYDFYVLTDHNRYYTSEMAIDAYKDVKLGMHIVKGEEVHTPDSIVHIVHAGGKYSVCDKYIHDRDGYDAEVAEIEKSLSAEMEEFYRYRLARAMWACREIKKAGGLSIFAHPFWKPDLYDVQEELCKLFFESDIFDAFELIGGCEYEGDDLNRALWQEYAMKGHALRIVGSSDSHLQDAAVKHFGNHYSYVFAKSNTTEDILQAVRDGYSVAVEQPLNSPEARMNAEQFRLVAYSHFLFRNYFNQTWCICNGEGNLMRRYLRGEADGKVLSELCNSVTDFYERFFGIKPPVAVSAERREFRDKWREIQKTGPETNGASSYVYGSNTRRL